MKYSYLILFLRTTWLSYRIWHLWESNHEFIATVTKSKTYGSIVYGANTVEWIRSCQSANKSIPYLLRMSEYTLSPQAATLYKRIWDMSQCLQNPIFLTNRMMESKYPLMIDYPDGLSSMTEENLSRALVLKDSLIESPHSTSEDNDWLRVAYGAAYELGEEAMNYLFWRPSHTPLYDKFAVVQMKMKEYYRAYYQFQFLAVDICDELHLFHTKFQTAMITSMGIYTGLGVLLVDSAAAYYTGDKGIVIVEGVSQALFPIR